MDAAEILAATSWLMLASTGADGRPHASYVPFAPLETGLGIVVSALAAHTRNLVDRPWSCALIVWDANVADGDYARPRLSIDVGATIAPPTSAQAASIWAALDARHGPIITMLASLPDFNAILLEPIGARLILGFAAAYELDRDATLEQLAVAQRGDRSR